MYKWYYFMGIITGLTMSTYYASNNWDKSGIDELLRQPKVKYGINSEIYELAYQNNTNFTKKKDVYRVHNIYAFHVDHSSDKEEKGGYKRVSKPDQVQVEKIKAPLVIGKNSMQKVITEFVSLTDEAIKLRDVKSTISRVETEISKNKVLVEGSIAIEVFYIGKDNLVYYRSLETGFSECVNIPGAKPGMEVVIKPEVEGIETRLIPDKNKVKQKLVLRFLAKVLFFDLLSVNTGEGPLIKTDRVVDQKTTEMVLNNEVKTAVEAADIINVVAQVEEPKVDILSDKVTVEAILHKELFYRGRNGDKHSQSEDISFNQFIELPYIEPGMQVEIKPRVENIKSKLNPEGNLVQQEFKILLPVTAIETVQLNLLPGSDSLAVLPEVVGENTTHLLKESFIPLPEQDFEIIEDETKIKAVKGKSLTDNVMVKGIINSHIYYGKENRCEYNQKIGTHFNTLIEVEGARPAMKVDIDINVDYVKKDLNSSGNLTQKVVLDLFVKVSNNIQFNLSRTNLS
ncbi:MAG: DUF3794 domain-containing protein [Halanaerobiales bacterium]|nr:DUF3794 domain-containing protein [Halanaerobiales bacterium]